MAGPEELGSKLDLQIACQHELGSGCSLCAEGSEADGVEAFEHGIASYRRVAAPGPRRTR
jgi:hypothetical protein